MGGKLYGRQPFKARSLLKIDTSPSAIRPSPLRRAASANCVTASMGRDFDGEPGANRGSASRLQNVTKRPASPMSPRYLMDSPQVHSPKAECSSPSLPVPPPSSHVIPAGNELNLYNIGKVQECPLLFLCYSHSLTRSLAMGYDTRTTFMIRNIPNKYTQV